MTIFIRALADGHKDLKLQEVAGRLRKGGDDEHVFQVSTEQFSLVPGSPFSYWVSEKVRSLYKSLPQFESDDRMARVGLQTSNDFRFVRAWWEVVKKPDSVDQRWYPFVRGGKASVFYGDLEFMLNWHNDGEELKQWNVIANNGGHWSRNIRSRDRYFFAGITWPLRTANMSPYPMPAGSIFSTRGTVAFCETERMSNLLGLMATSTFDFLFKMMLGRFGHPEFSIGSVQKVPVPALDNSELGLLAEEGWALKRELKSTVETSYAFLLPHLLRENLDGFDPFEISQRVETVVERLDEIGFELYGFDEADKASMQLTADEVDDENRIADEEKEDSRSSSEKIQHVEDLLSWCLGVVFGRFDIRLATSDRQMPETPGVFDPLPDFSPGMILSSDSSFHEHPGMLVDDPGHQHDLSQLIESVLERVDYPLSQSHRRWLQKEFFKAHLKRYSKSGRKSPIYWPLATASGSYTLWLYYPNLDDQTLYTAVNDFLEPKLKLVGDELNSLRAKSGRSAAEERELEKQQGLELELIELRDTMVEIAPSYKPNQDDGVQITAAPLWPLFRHKPWQKVLKDTWGELEAGDYDWAHLAYSYWPGRVREKCKSDKSLAIAHGLEELYEEPEA